MSLNTEIHDLKQVKHPVVLAGLAINGSTIMRRLSRLGYEVHAVSSSKHEPGWHSRHGTKTLVTDPSQDYSSWLNEMIELAKRFDHPVPLLPLSDAFVVALDRAAREAEWPYLTHGFGTGVRTSLTSKKLTFELANQYQLPSPACRFINDREQLADFAASVDGPILFKPDFQFQWKTGGAANVAAERKVMVEQNLDRLMEEYDRISKYTPGVLAQEVIPGDDDALIYWCGFIGPGGRPGGRFVGRKRRLHPVHYGSASFVQLIDRPDIDEQCCNFLNKLGYEGLCGIEFKEDSRDGVARLIEVNPRYGLWDDIAVPAGIDIARQAVDSLLGIVPDSRYLQGAATKWFSLRLDVAAFLSYRREGSLTLGGWLKSLAPPIVINDFPLFTDPGYALHTISRPFVKRMKSK